jgi:putative type I restriction-modification system, S subunit
MSNWQYSTLGEILPFKYGKGLPERKRSGTGEFNVVSSAGITGTHNTALTSEPCVVIGRKGTIGSLHFCPGPVWPIDTTFYVTGSEHIEIRYAYYLLHTLPLATMNNDSAIPGLNRSHAESIKVCIPSIVEQRRIIDVLGALDDKIESNLRAISLSESLILAHFSSLFNSGPVSAGTALSDLMDVNPRYSLKRESLAIKVSMQDIPSDFPVINTHTVMPVGAGSRFSNGDVLFARISPCLENGKTAIVDFLSSSKVGFGSTEFIVLSPRGEISTTWIYALARDPDFREACRQAMSGSSGRQRLSADFFSRYTIATPKESDLVAFNEATMPLLTFMGARRDENQRLAPLRDALLPELMSGRMRVDEAGRLVSEALNEEAR